jgi:hypothetical protein
MGSCGEALPSGRSYNASLLGVSCGSDTQPRHFTRTTLPMTPEMRQAWKFASGKRDEQAMQKAARQQQKFTAEIGLPMEESWTWQQKVGDFDPRFGTERYTTQCYVSRTQHQSHWETVTDYDNCLQDRATSQCESYETDYSHCLEYERDDDSSSSFGGGAYYGGSSGSNRNRNRGSSSGSSSGSSRPRNDSGAGESRRSNKRRYDRSENEYRPSTDELKPLLLLAADRKPAASCRRYAKTCARYRRECVRYGTKQVLRWTETDLGNYAYTCEKTRPLWGEWFETRTESRNCRPQAFNFSIDYTTAKDWSPGYTDSAKPERNYHNSIPNQWDLLPGESEDVTLVANQKSSGPTVQPGVSICSRFKPGTSECFENGWNEYRIKPVTVSCQYSPKSIPVSIEVETLGRVLRKAPNPLKAVKDGTNGTSLVFDAQSSRPSAVMLQDTAREAMLDAAENSRTFGNNKDTSANGASASGGYWQETRFKMRLLQRARYGKLERTTIPNTFGSNQGDIFDDTMTISLEGKDGLDRLYRPGGPAEWLFSDMYKHFGVELTPGETYILKISLVQRGMPWYEAGCHDGTTICEGEDAKNEAYSDEIEVEFQANPSIDNRSLWKRFKDWQKHFRIL